jgi:serine/threonine-protein phosphatase 2A activator
MGNESNAVLSRLDPHRPHVFSVPVKKIHEGEDVSFFLRSRGYSDLMTFLLQLNASMFPGKIAGDVHAWEIGASDAGAEVSAPVQNLHRLLNQLRSLIDQAPPDPGPRRFGNISFRKWYQLVEAKLPAWLEEYLPENVLQFTSANDVSPLQEIQSYLLGSFGSAQRLDYGSGHELSFLAFLACIWKLDGFANQDWGVEERGIVLGVIQP